MSRTRKLTRPLVVVVMALVSMIATAIPANATSWSWKVGGDCSNLVNRYQFQAAYGNTSTGAGDSRLIAYGSRSDNWTCTRLYTGGGEKFNATVNISRECTKKTILATKKVTGVRNLAVWVTEATNPDCIITVEAWTNAGFGTEYTKVTTPPGW